MIRGFLDAGGVRGMGVRAWKNLDRPLIHANLSQSHLALSQARRAGDSFCFRVAFAGEIYSLRESQKRGKTPAQKNQKRKK